MLVEERWPFEDPTKIQLFSLNTPNGVKVAAALEELGVPYEPHTINIMKDDQFAKEYVSINPNSKIPVVVIPGTDGAPPRAIFESGAILIHLADQEGKLLSKDPVLRSETLQWLFFQVGHIGPMFGQFGHFFKFAKDKCDHPYPLERYSKEATRLFGVLDARLEGREYLVGDEYSIADIATWPWVSGLIHFYQASDHLDIPSFANVTAWLERCTSRPASQRAKSVTSLR
ncbi:MAG: glutathione binding-like protein [Myxococcota bacterium]